MSANHPVAEVGNVPVALTDTVLREVLEGGKTLHTELGGLMTALKDLPELQDRPDVARRLDDLEHCRTRLAGETGDTGTPSVEVLSQTAVALEALGRDIEHMQAVFTPCDWRRTLTHVAIVICFTLTLTAALTLATMGLAGAMAPVWASLAAASGFGGAYGFLALERRVIDREFRQDQVMRQLETIASVMDGVNTLVNDQRAKVGDNTIADVGAGPSDDKTRDPLARFTSVITHTNQCVKNGRAAVGEQTIADIRAGLRDAPTREAFDRLLGKADTPAGEHAIAGALSSHELNEPAMGAIVQALKFGELRFGGDSATTGPERVRCALEQLASPVKRGLFETDESLRALRQLQTCLVRTSVLDGPADALSGSRDDGAHRPLRHPPGIPVA
ncbi:hypothetical protein [Pandoraea oxalativorans]|uniref:hypothetical protein n=1 Tax=Pandoraea oxalativorans TaxID=573737 RepID=UPI0012F49799|nr:hypothetical protein [Pandoraea oxalativorans]